MAELALWEQVSSLPLRDQLDLVERIEATIPRVRDAFLPNDTNALADALARAREETTTHPEELLTAEALVESIRAELLV
ncbi:MAG: hypothetical protein LBE83_02055 [Propionibacteriaceae bacterium]|jgi:1,4-dihydroxy-2-naphthoyl-CoA synthase|nr:hypothetical protein [Propionibacteriaceae bacterium]